MSGPSLKKNFAYNTAYQVLTIIVPFITTPYVSRVLGANNIGIYSFVNANLVYFVLFGVFGLTTYSQLEVAKRRDDPKELNRFCVESLFTRFFTMGISLFVFVIIYIIGNSTHRIYYAISFCALLSNAFDFTWICQGLEEFRIVTIRNFIVKLFCVVCVFVFVKTRNDLVIYFIINSTSALAGNISLYPYARKYLSLKEIEKIHIFPHLKASLVYFLPSTASVLITTTDKLMIGWFSVDMVQNGFYEQAMKVENMIFMIFAALNLTMRPRMAYLYKSGQISEINRYMKKSLSFVIFLALPIVAGLIQIADVFVPWFFGAGYEGVVALLRIMSFWILIKSVSNCLLEQSIVPKGGQVLATKIIWCAAILNIVLNYILIPRFSSVGAAIASLSTEILILLLTIITVQKDINIISLFPKQWKAIISAVFMYFSVQLAKGVMSGGIINTIVIVLFGAAVYFVLEIVLRDDLVKDGLEMVLSKMKD